jgi:hypothetical protein
MFQARDYGGCIVDSLLIWPISILRPANELWKS